MSNAGVSAFPPKLGLCAVLPLVILSSAAFVQQVPAPPLSEVMELEAAVSSVMWTKASRESGALRSAADVFGAVEMCAKKKGTTASESALYGAVRDRLPAVRALIFKLLSGREAVRFAYLEDDCPIRIATFGSDVVVLLGGVYSSQVYNTLQLTARERAAHAFRTSTLPVVRTVGNTSLPRDVGLLGVAVTYGSRNLLEKSEIPTPETLFVLSPVSLASAFASGEVSEDEYLEKSAVFLKDLETKTPSRVRLILR